MTSHFDYHDRTLCADHTPLTAIAEQFGTPCFVYSADALSESFASYANAFAGQDHLVCFALKANSNLSIIRHFARLGAGFDIVSGGELQRVLAAGGDAGRVVFSGVGKSEAEMRLALEAGVLCFNVESVNELERLNQVAGAMGRRAPVSLRVNPDVDAKTHPYISTGLKDNKFGIAYAEARAVYRRAAALANLDVVGIDCHIGSQLTDLTPLLDALDRLLLLVDQLAEDGITLHHLDIGGGVGIRYRDETPPDLNRYAQAVREKLADRKLKVLMEPGRSLVGNAGVCLTEVIFTKPGEQKNFCIVDAAMNDLPRPAMYEAFHQIVPVAPRSGEAVTYDVVGPICESGDWLGRDRSLVVQSGDLLAVLSTGAYCMSMASTYNTRGRAAEVLVDGDKAHLIRQRESAFDTFALEQLVG